MKRTLLVLVALLALLGALALMTSVVTATPTGEAVISYPFDGMQVSGTIQIRCDALINSPSFGFYKVEFSLGEKPSGWGAVSNVKKEPPKDGVCDTWDTTKFPNGPAFLKLTVVDNTANYLEDTVQVVINNGGAAAGSQACQACHPTQYASWKATKHGQANIGCETCHGPGATHIALGGNKAYIDKVYAAGQCGTCHKETFAQWQESLHNNHPDLAEFGRSPCQNCHTAQGYVNVQFKGDTKFTIGYHAEGETCATCHEPHSAQNPGQLRFVGTSKLPNGKVINVGLAANCANCHNQRRDVADITNQVNNAFGRGPHEGTSSDLFAGTGAWEFPGKGYTFPSSAHPTVVKDACVTCHMKPTANATPMHQMKPLLAACQNCHGANFASFEVKAKGDYDGNGEVGTVQEEVEGLMKLVEAQLPPMPYESNKKLDTPAKRGAAYNILFVERDRSEGVHNTLYAIGLLQASYKEVTGSDVPGAAIVYKTGAVTLPATEKPVVIPTQAPAGVPPVVAPAAQPTAKPTAAAQTAGTPPNIPANHFTAGCTACHAAGAGGAPKFPASHTAFTDAQCTTCHKPK